jgi:hypothetical protein
MEPAERAVRRCWFHFLRLDVKIMASNVFSNER